MNDLGVLLENLSTQEGRAKVVKELVNLGNQVPEHYVTEAIDFFKRDGEEFTHKLVEAAKIAEDAGMHDTAVNIYNTAISKEERKHPHYAARIAEDAGMHDTAVKLYLKASVKEELSRDFYYAAKYAENATEITKATGRLNLVSRLKDKTKKLFKKTVENFPGEINLDRDDKETAEMIKEITEKAGMPEEVQRLYEKAINKIGKKWETIPGAGYRDALKFAKYVGMPSERIRELTLLAIDGFAGDRYYDAVELSKSIGITTVPINIKEKMLKTMAEYRSADEVAELAEELGLTGKAMEYYGKAMERAESEGGFGKAAEFAEKAGMSNKAQLYRELKAVIKKEYLF